MRSRILSNVRHVCKLRVRVVSRSRLLRVVCNLMKDRRGRWLPLVMVLHQSQ